MAVWGQARKEVLSNSPLILQRIEGGNSIRSIWIELSSDGRVSVSLRKFHSQVRKLLVSAPVKPAGHRQPGLVSASSPARNLSGPSPDTVTPRITNVQIAELGDGLLPADIASDFGQIGLGHNPHAKALRAEAADSGAQPTQTKEQKDAG